MTASRGSLTTADALTVTLTLFLADTLAATLADMYPH